MNNNQKQQTAEMLTSTTFTKQLVGAPFMTVFKATLGFYVAQSIVTLIGLGILATVIVTIGYFLK